MSLLIKIKQLLYLFSYNVGKELVYQRFTDLTNIPNCNDFILLFILFVIIMFLIQVLLMAIISTDKVTSVFIFNTLLVLC